MATQTKKKLKLQTVKVHGYWHTVSDTEWLKGKRPYYVKGYKYKRKSSKGITHKKHLDVTLRPGKEIRYTPKGYVLEKHYRYFEDNPEAKEEPALRVVYTYKIEALVEYQGRYLMSFSMDKNLKGQMAVEYYHTYFEPTIEQATADFKAKVPVFNAYGHIVEYLSIDLYQVTGEGPLPDRQWKLLRSFDNPEDVK
jgi:hypothetical protein